MPRAIDGLGGGHYAVYAKNRRAGQRYIMKIGMSTPSALPNPSYRPAHIFITLTVREYEQRPPVAKSGPKFRLSSISSMMHYYGNYLSAPPLQDFQCTQALTLTLAQQTDLNLTHMSLSTRFQVLD
ncbi:hypothetical protein BGZ96_010049 [Linnemannia gamsii]|uniref:Uncharacterized protein n=1 Tax=Linnemannia gamsii TaxID=64522 RepID=A0ABQ7JVT2_9FUNG|nr:hypothetical protein BGZ96_010049 [Linnemannia gamsii]